MKHSMRQICLALAVVLVAGGCAPRFSPIAFEGFSLAEPKRFTAHRVSSNNPDLNSNDDSFRPIPGETVVLADLEGPGVVTHLWMTIAQNEYGWPRLLRLRIYYDGSETPSVDAPIGDFFAVGNGNEGEVESLMVRNSSSGRARNCYWPMPFRKSCKITVTNEGRRRVSMLYYHVDWRKVDRLPVNTPYFHAWYRQALPAPPDGSFYELLNVKGNGHYVGTVMSVVQAEAGWFGEGDDLFSVDGRAPEIMGTGTEDYFNDAWGLHVNDGPHYGVTVAEGTGLGSRMTAYRWHLADPVPFKKSLKVEMEHRGWTYRPDGAVKSAFGERTDLISSVAFWYQQGVANDLPAMPYGSARLPHGNATQLEVEKWIGECRANEGKASLSPELFWSKDVVLFEPERESGSIEVPFEVSEEGDYEIYTEVAQGPNYGVYTVLLDGKAAQAPSLEHEPGADVLQQTKFDGYATETYVGLAYQVGWARLTKGRHTLTYQCKGKNERSAGYALGVDNVVLARVGAEGWALVARAKQPGVPSDTAALRGVLRSDSDHVTRGLAALALRDQGMRAASALPELVAGLRDADVGVRMMCANAIASIGPAAAEAVPALIAAGEEQSQHVHVLRSVAAALGSIGKPHATQAMRVLERLTKIPRVEWAAKAAIQKLQ